MAGRRCDSKISGDSITWLPKLQGSITGPPRSPLLWSHVGGLSCSTRLETGDNQSILLTVRQSDISGLINLSLNIKQMKDGIDLKLWSPSQFMFVSCSSSHLSPLTVRDLANFSLHSSAVTKQEHKTPNI